MKYIAMTLCILTLGVACSVPRPTNLGVKAGRLVPCPGKSNCVVSNEDDQKHYIAPIPYEVDQEAAFQVLKDIVITMERAEIIEETPIYLRLEYKTKTFGFVDDVEFYFPSDPVILIRSASRVGYSDFGVNRKRLESVRAMFEEKIKEVPMESQPEDTESSEE